MDVTTVVSRFVRPAVHIDSMRRSRVSFVVHIDAVPSRSINGIDLSKYAVMAAAAAVAVYFRPDVGLVVLGEISFVPPSVFDKK